MLLITVLLLDGARAASEQLEPSEQWPWSRHFPFLLPFGSRQKTAAMSLLCGAHDIDCLQSVVVACELVTARTKLAELVECTERLVSEPNPPLGHGMSLLSNDTHTHTLDIT